MSATRDWAEEAASELPPIANVAEAAKFLRVSTRTLKRYIALGRIQSVRFGDSGAAGVRIPRSAVADFLRERAS